MRTKSGYPQHIQHDDATTFIDVEKIDMILESPHGAFKDVFAPEISQPPTYRVVGTLGMVSIVYLFTCGGPIGSEPIVSAGGPLVGMICLLLYPFLVTIPYAYIVAELCSAFPEDGGFTIWVLNAFGPYWGFQVGYWSWISGVVRTALIPETILDLFLSFYDMEIESKAMRFFVKAGMAIVLTVPACFGTKNVARLSCLLLVVVIVPFLTYTVWAYTGARDFDDLFQVRHETTVYDRERADVETEGSIEIDWTVLVNTLFHKFDGIYMASVFGGEVMNPARTYPRAIFFTVLLAVATYLVPIPASIVADDLSWVFFGRDAYPFMAERIGGSFLKTFILIASVGGALGTFISGIYLKAFQVSGMAVNRLLPSILARRRSRFESPNHAIIGTAIVTIALLPVSFDDLLHMSNAFAAAVEFTIIVAAMRLRMTLPYIPRPTKVPGGVPGLLMFAAVPGVVLGYILVHTFMTSLIATLLMVGLLAVGLVYGVWSTRWS
ncbi:hypothetical protein Poli38472_007272 [Pythium oligandrum]|uniref:Uncharacterized protein n=1 Tax=Pythium oligandrum TaxID=41045 RepID=A0A8K1CB08_PYTOL|nr:hypothetical protein Poli38472_007272 [Pythium oligandrum]|eukprot:TMW59127.1 hypothetical protein Poli38472_007272 [Pythium oligandrum]